MSLNQANICKFGINIYTLLYLKQIPNKDLLYSTGNSAQYSVIKGQGFLSVILLNPSTVLGTEYVFNKQVLNE